MPEDISFQPQSKEFIYSSSARAKQKRLEFFRSILPQIKKKKSVIIYLIITFTFLFIFAIGILNYFNFLPVSNIFPKTLGFLPHEYNLSASESALANVPYSKDLNGYYLEGNLVNVAGNKLLISYKHKVAEFLFGADLKCEKIISRKLSNGDEQISNSLAFCDELFKKWYIGKPVTIVYQKTSESYILRELAIQTN